MIIMKIFIWLPGNLYMKSGIHPPQKAGAARRAASETADHNTRTTKKNTNLDVVGGFNTSEKH